MIQDPNEMAAEYITCCRDKSRIAFIEKNLSTFDATRRREVPFHLFPRQRVFLKTLGEVNNIVSIKPRQCGITTLTSAWATAACVFAAKDSPETILCIGNKMDLADQLISKIRAFLMQVPRWYWGNDYYSADPKSDKNEKTIFITDSKHELKLFNGCRIVSRSSGENAARGISAVSILILDEAAFIENGMAVYATCAATMASNPNSKTVMVSTPNGHDKLYYNTYKQALAKENNFVAVQFRWYQDPRYNRGLTWHKKNSSSGDDMVDADEIIDSQKNVRYDEERWEKLIRDGWKPTSAWYEDMKMQFNNDAVKIAQELDVSFMGSANNVIAPEFITMQTEYNVKDPLEDLRDPMNEDMWFWKPPIQGHKYILACDPSRGISADRTAIEIIDMNGVDENGMPIIEQVAEYLGKKLGDDIGGMLYQYGKMYFDAYIVIDSTGGCGDAAILTLINMGYKNMYYDDNIQKNYMNQNRADNSSTTNLPGFHFQGNRYPVLASFAGMVRNNEFKIRSIRVANELDTWIFEGQTGRMNHQDGAHDDTICSLAMGLFVMKYTYNRIENERKMDKAILGSYIRSNNIDYSNRRNVSNLGTASISPSANRPNQFFTSSSKEKRMKSIDNPNGSYMWLFVKNY